MNPCLVRAEARTHYKKGVGIGIGIDFFNPDTDSDPDPEMTDYNVLNECPRFR